MVMLLKNYTGVFSPNSLQYREMTTSTKVYLSFGLRDKVHPWVQRMYPWIYHIPWTQGYSISLSQNDIPDQEVTCVAQHTVYETHLTKKCKLYRLYTSTSTYRLPYFIVKHVTLQPKNTKTLKKKKALITWILTEDVMVRAVDWREYRAPTMPCTISCFSIL